MRNTLFLLLLMVVALYGFNVTQNEDMDAPKSTTGQLSTFLTFQDGNAEEAMNFYIDLFDNSKVIEVQRYGPEGPAPEGSVMVARFLLNGRAFMCSDSPIEHEWNFTPGVSTFVDCRDKKQLLTLYQKLSTDGKIYMPLNNYGFSQQFAFVEDKYGVSWQLNLK